MSGTDRSGVVQAYLRGARLELEVVIPIVTEADSDPRPNTPADTLFIVYERR